jgi:hypothetical protein
LSTGFIGLQCTITVTTYHNVHPLQYFSRTRHKAGNGSSACSTTTFFRLPLPSIPFLRRFQLNLPATPRIPTTTTWIPLRPQLQLLAATQSSEVYDLWSDCREHSAFGIDYLAITRETGTLRPRACTLPSNVHSTAYMLQYQQIHKQTYPQT